MFHCFLIQKPINCYGDYFICIWAAMKDLGSLCGLEVLWKEKEVKKRIWSIVFTVISLMILCILPERITLAADPAVTICGIDLPAGNYMDNSKNVGMTKPAGGYAYFDGSKLTLNGFEVAANSKNNISTINMFDVTNLFVKGINNISNSYYNNSSLFSNTDLNISGEGTLNADSTGNNSCGIEAKGNITINSGIVNASGTDIGIWTRNALKISGGTVSAVGAETGSIGCEIDNGITITGGTLYATGSSIAAYSFPFECSALVKGSLSYNAAKDSLGTVTWAQTGTDPDSNIYALYYPNYVIGTIVAKTLYIDAEPSKDSTSSVAICNHNYEWIVENEPTEDETGLLVEKCTKCGNIRSSQVIPAIKDDYGRCMYERTKQILRAKSGQTITIDIGYWDTLPKSFFEALANKRDITVKVKFMNKGKHYEFTVAPGQTIDTSLDYYGPEMLIQKYGAKEVKTK